MHKRIIYNIKRVLVYVVFALLSTPMAPALASAGPPPPPYPSDPFSKPSVPEEVPQCIAMPNAQIPGEKPGSACQVPIMVTSPSTAAPSNSMVPMALYRRGWTDRWTSESDSDLIEDRIKVEGYLYLWVSGGGYWALEDNCEDDNNFSSHAACRTYGGGSGSSLKQDGYHYFHTSGYVDDHFQTQDRWTG